MDGLQIRGVGFHNGFLLASVSAPKDESPVSNGQAGRIGTVADRRDARDGFRARSRGQHHRCRGGVISASGWAGEYNAEKIVGEFRLSDEAEAVPAEVRQMQHPLFW